MGLDVTHDCFSGAYSSFMRFRIKLAEVAGLPPLLQFEHYRPLETDANAPTYSWAPYAGDPLVILLDHSDCDGEIAVEHLLPLAARLEELAAKMPADDDGGGHITRAGGYKAVTLKFAKGLRKAARKGERVEFQ